MSPELDRPRIQIQRIVASKAFKTSEVHRNLLTYLADKSLAGEAQNLKEYTVGLDVFGKPSSYDPRQDSVVRIQVGRCGRSLPNTTALRARAIPWLSTSPRADSN